METALKIRSHFIHVHQGRKGGDPAFAGNGVVITRAAINGRRGRNLLAPLQNPGSPGKQQR